MNNQTKNDAVKKLNTYLNGDKLAVKYTFLSDDLSKGGKKNFGKPYHDRKEYFAENYIAPLTESKLKVSNYLDGIKLVLTTKNNQLSEFGIELPINFMGKKNGGGWSNQYLLNSPYSSHKNTYKYCYLSNPNGKNLMIFPKGKCDGWKCNYSSDYCPGHFFISLEFLANFDKIYKTGSCNKRLELYIFEVKDLNHGLDKMCEVLKTSALTFEISSAKIGSKIKLDVHGECDYVRVGRKKYSVKNSSVFIDVNKYGLISAYPYKDKKRGMNATFYGYDSIQKVYKRALDSVSDEDLARTDQNLCEHQCWQSSMMRYMMRYGKVKSFAKRLKPAFDIIMETDVNKALPRRTIFNKAHKGESAYYIFESGRIQELLFGVTILNDAYKWRGSKKYFTYFTKALDCVLKTHFDHGMIYTNFLNNTKEDYTTVCALIIPFIDAFLTLKDSHPELALKYKRASKEIAEYLYNRKGFHTEAFVSDLTDPEMEDGSISCTALSLLYYCAKVEREEKYLAKAKEILDIHEAWITYVPIAPCFHSTLRWWETFWNADATGPSICFGDPWAIWRAEADYWYYYLTKDEKYKTKAINGFGCNFSKVLKNGKTFSQYLLDYIPGGGFKNDCNETIYEIRLGIPKRRDSGRTRYVWIRASETVLNEKDMF